MVNQYSVFPFKTQLAIYERGAHIQRGKRKFPWEESEYTVFLAQRAFYGDIKTQIRYVVGYVTRLYKYVLISYAKVLDNQKRTLLFAFGNKIKKMKEEILILFYQICPGPTYPSFLLGIKKGFFIITNALKGKKTSLLNKKRKKTITFLLEYFKFFINQVEIKKNFKHLIT